MLGDEPGTVSGETITWHGTGAGRFDEACGVSRRGALFHETAAAVFARLNGVCTVFEFDAEESGKAGGSLYEWEEGYAVTRARSRPS
ncbi:hypothetical protein ACH4A8_03155 [Streptomyces vietnamensis]|uniref:hypothetical protein n=1 Tax=Streptomyces vietnamensis TaxID=362257 RepID=UPI00378EA2C8